MSGSFDEDDGVVPRPPPWHDERTATPSTPNMSASQLSTPIMSQQNALDLILSTPPADDFAGGEGTPSNDPSAEEEDRATSMSMLPFPSNPSRHTTPSIFNSQPATLEPPAWKPPEAEEVEHLDACWNTHEYNSSQHHFLQPVAQDDSTIGSNQTNGSLVNNVNFNAPLRPRGLSLCSYTDAASVGSAPQPQQKRAQHRRHPSLPVSFFSSATSQHGSGQLLSPQHDGHSPSYMKRQYLNALSTKQSAPYELHSHHNASQVRADGAMAGLDGVLLDLYMVDRSVDSASAAMLATRDGTMSQQEERGHSEGTIRAKGGVKRPSPQKARKTSLGTLNDIQTILELHKVDRLVDRFKQDLQMPEFFEEEAWESTVWKDLRKTDVEMEEYAARKRAKESKDTTKEMVSKEVPIPGQKDVIRYQFDLSDDNWKKDQKLGGEGIYLTAAESHLTDYDAYQFFDPHETEVLRANAYQPSQVAASLSDDLHEVIDLLRTDVEVDGASRYHKEMDAIRPLLETDREISKLREQLEARGVWDSDLRALFLTDLEIDGAKRKSAAKPKKTKQAEVVDNLPSEEGKAGNDGDDTKQPDPLPKVDSTEQAEQCSDQEVKDMLSQHIPQVPQLFCPTSPEFRPMRTSNDLTMPPPAPWTSPEASRRVINSIGESSANDNNNDENAVPKPITKRSIFSSKEKTTAATKCGYQRGVMMPGTTTVVMARGGEMIDDIPVGKVVMR